MLWTFSVRTMQLQKGTSESRSWHPGLPQTHWVLTDEVGLWENTRAVTCVSVDYRCFQTIAPFMGETFMRGRPFQFLPLTGERSLLRHSRLRTIHLGLVIKTLVPLDPGSVFSAIKPAVIDSVYGHRHQTCVFTGHYLSWPGWGVWLLAEGARVSLTSWTFTGIYLKTLPILYVCNTVPSRQLTTKQASHQSTTKPRPAEGVSLIDASQPSYSRRL